MYKLLVVNGPNLNLLGTREPGIYGSKSLADLTESLHQFGAMTGCSVAVKQSNYEGELVEIIHQAGFDGIDFIVINAAAYTHTSIAIRDALAGVNIPFVEVHISNVYSRSEYRHHSFLADIAQGVITGLGFFGYEVACQYALYYLQEN